MRGSASFAIALVTCPDLKTARRLAKSALQLRLVACANLVPGLESHYRWQSKLEKSSEVLILFKTSQRRIATLEKLIIQEHPYDTPEFVVLQVDAGNRRYLDWWQHSLKGPSSAG